MVMKNNKQYNIPNPQFYRKAWSSLNGKWDYYVFADGETQKYQINVPFCPESRLSGLGLKGYIKECAYARHFEIDSLSEYDRIVLHFGAVDYKAEVYVNDCLVGTHEGGYTPFEIDCTSAVKVGENRLCVKVYDDIHADVPSGKQSPKPHSFGCFYTRTTGIWQDVWLERTPKKYIKNVKFYPHIDMPSVDVELFVEGEGEAEIQIFYKNKLVGSAKSEIAFRKTFTVDLKEKHLWEPGNGRLYDVKITFAKDEVESYFGLREVCFDGEKFLVNGKSVFQRFVLDQGYNPEGGYTSPSDSWMIADIERGLRLGFNGARLHQKVFEPRFLYHCDKMGYMVWGEFPSWGIKYDRLDSLPVFVREWMETIERDFNHPSIVLWCPLNETWKDLEDARKTRDVRYIDAVYSLTKSIDETRPCVDVSGGFHGHATDLYDFHCYESYEKLEQYIKTLENENVLDVPLLYDESEPKLRYFDGYPVNVSEYGGIRFSTTPLSGETATIDGCVVDCENSWGYGKGETNEDEFICRYKELTKLIMDCPKISGFCYTQLYDVEQEENGLFTYDRKPKLSEQAMDRIAARNKMLAAIEKQDDK